MKDKATNGDNTMAAWIDTTAFYYMETWSSY